MQVGIDVTYMLTNFDGRELFGFGDISTFKSGQISLSTHGQSMVIKNINQSESAKKIHASRD